MNSLLKSFQSFFLDGVGPQKALITGYDFFFLFWFFVVVLIIVIQGVLTYKVGRKVELEFKG